MDQAQDRDEQRPEPDQEELQDLVEDRREQPAERHVDRHGQRGDPDAQVDVPAEQQVQDLGHGEHARATDHHGQEGERDACDGTRAFAVAELQVARHRVGAADVVERHHHHCQEQDRGDGADQVRVRAEHAVLIGHRRPAHGLERAQVGRDERKARDPGGHLATSHEEVVARGGVLLEIEADRQHDHEVDDDDHKVDGGQREQARRACGGSMGQDRVHLGSPCSSGSREFALRTPGLTPRAPQLSCSGHTLMFPGAGASERSTAE